MALCLDAQRSLSKRSVVRRFRQSRWSKSINANRLDSSLTIQQSLRPGDEGSKSYGRVALTTRCRGREATRGLGLGLNPPRIPQAPSAHGQRVVRATREERSSRRWNVTPNKADAGRKKVSGMSGVFYHVGLSVLRFGSLAPCVILEMPSFRPTGRGRG